MICISVPGYADVPRGLKIIVNAMLFLEEPLRTGLGRPRAFPKGTTLEMSGRPYGSGTGQSMLV